MWDDDTLIAALPLGLARRRVTLKLPIKVLTLSMLYDDRVGFHDVLIRPGHETAAASQLIAACKQTGARYMDLTPLRPSPATQALRSAANGRWSHERVEIVSSFADVSAGWDAYLAQRSSNTRKQMRKRLRQMESDGAVARYARREDADAGDILQDVFAVSAKSWKATNGTDIGSKAQDRAFFEALFYGMQDSCRMMAGVLYLNDKPVANEILLNLRGDIFNLMSDYDEGYANHGVGTTVLCVSLRNACDENARHMDFLRQTPFLESYADNTQDLVRLRIALRPSLAPLLIRGQFAVRGLRERLFGAKTRVTGRRKFFGMR